ncbi:MAG: hypothetical protein ACTSX8_03830 [Alphaproteobacteria bacterium]
MRVCAWLFVAFALPGCQVNPAPSEGITLQDDKFRPFVEYATGTIRLSSYPNYILLKLIARIDRKTGKTSTLVSVTFVYSARHMRKYESARNARAEVLRFYKPTRHRSCEKRACVVNETLMIEIPETELRQASPDGYKLKVFARDGSDMLIAIPRGAIERLLAKLDKQPGPKA